MSCSALRCSAGDQSTGKHISIKAEGETNYINDGSDPFGRSTKPYCSLNSFNEDFFISIFLFLSFLLLHFTAGITGVTDNRTDDYLSLSI